MRLPTLTNFDLEFANLSYLPHDLLDFRHIKYLKLGGNPWDCSCTMAWLLEFGLDLNQGSRTPE